MVVVIVLPDEPLKAIVPPSLAVQVTEAPEAVSFDHDETPRPQSTVIGSGSRARDNELERPNIGSGASQCLCGASLQQGI